MDISGSVITLSSGAFAPLGNVIAHTAGSTLSTFMQFLPTLLIWSIVIAIPGFLIYWLLGGFHTNRSTSTSSSVSSSPSSLPASSSSFQHRQQLSKAGKF